MSRQKIDNAYKRLAKRNFVIPSPDEIARSRFTAAQLAEWGVAWPPAAGWRVELERRWRAGMRKSVTAVAMNGQVSRPHLPKPTSKGDIFITDGLNPDGTMNVHQFSDRASADAFMASPMRGS